MSTKLRNAKRLHTFRVRPTTVLLAAVLLAVAATAAESCAAEPEAAGQRPNFLLIFADDLGYETLGCYGGKDFDTPHLNRLAGEGMRFSRAYTSPVCTPSRMSLYTGTYVSRHRYDSVLPVHVGTRRAVDFKNTWPTYAQVLRDAGYATSVTGKWQLAALEYHPQHILSAGFDSWCVWQIWRNNAKTTRYYQPCLNHDGKIRGDIAERFGPDVLTDYVIDQMKTAVGRKQPFFIHHNMMLPHVPVTPLPHEKAAGKKGSLASMIGYMDKLAGKLVAAVDELGIADNTWIIFMGDNGTDSRKARRTGDQVVKGGKRDLTDAGTHIPMIVRRGGMAGAGTTASDLIDMADWFATFCELAAVDVPQRVQLDGRSFAPRLTSNKPFNRKFVTAGINRKLSVFDGQMRVTTGDAVTSSNAVLHKVLQSLPTGK